MYRLHVIFITARIV